MEQSNIFIYFFAGVGALFAILVIAYLILKKKMESSEVRQSKSIIFPPYNIIS